MVVVLLEEGRFDAEVDGVFVVQESLGALLSRRMMSSRSGWAVFGWETRSLVARWSSF